MIEYLGIPVVQAHDPVTNPQSFMRSIKDLEGSEGVIIVWPNGHRVKIKGDWYISRHKAKDKILRENGLIELILNDAIDDVKPVLDIEDRHRLEKFEREFWRGVLNTEMSWQEAYRQVRGEFGHDRKQFALTRATDLEQNLRGVIFRAWDNPDVDFRAAVIDAVRKNMGTQTKVNEARHLWGGAEWNYRDNGEA
jgi:RNA ligase